jgi:TPR repeat protein
MYETGEAVQHSDERAAAFFLEAAELGLSRAQVKYAEFCAAGRGTNLNLVEAYKWLAIATELEDSSAKEPLLALEQQMNPANIEKGKKEAQAWAAIHPEEIFIELPDPSRQA